MLILFPAVRRCSPTPVRRPRVPNQLARRQHGLRRPDSVPATRGRWIAPRWPRLPQRWHGLVRRQRILVSLQLWQSCVRYRVIRSESEQYLAKHNSCSEERNRIANDMTMKAYGQVAYITEKNTLAYVLSFFGLGAASYENEYIAGSGYTSRVRFKVPDVESAVCDGMINWCLVHIMQKKLHIMQAFLEDELNYDIQIKAKEGHKMILNLLDSFQALGEKVRKAWKHFNICMQDVHDLYSSDHNIINEDGFSDNQSNILEDALQL